MGKLEGSCAELISTIAQCLVSALRHLETLTTGPVAMGDKRDYSTAKGAEVMS